MLGLLAFQMLPQLFSKGGTANMQVHDLYWSFTFGYMRLRTCDLTRRHLHYSDYRS